MSKFGLVCISEILKNQGHSFKTMTRKSFLSLNRNDAIIKLGAICLHNVKHTHRTIQHCADNGIWHYRISSSLFPLLTDSAANVSFGDLPNWKEIEEELGRTRELSDELGISLSIHPDQYNQLGSYSPAVVSNTVRELNFQGWVLDKMGLENNYNVPMCLHVGCSPKNEEPQDFSDRFMENLSKCHLSVRNRLVLENEDKGFWNPGNLISYFGRAGMPFVFDNLHFKCNSGDLNENFVIEMFRESWRGHTPVFHFSEGIGNTRSHAKEFSCIPAVVMDNWDCVWECEVKNKDEAILKLLKHG